MTIEIGSDDLLWQTRGKEWEYDFISIPVSPNIQGWLSYISRVFPDSGNPQDTPRYGVLTTRECRHNFVAMYVRDKGLTDASHRPIDHYIAWFPKVPDYSTPDWADRFRAALPDDWGQQIVEHFKKHYQTVFDLALDKVRDMGRLGDNPALHARRSLKAAPPLILRLDNTSRPATWRGPIKVKISETPASSPAPPDIETSSKVDLFSAVRWLLNDRRFWIGVGAGLTLLAVIVFLLMVRSRGRLSLSLSDI